MPTEDNLPTPRYKRKTFTLEASMRRLNRRRSDEEKRRSHLSADHRLFSLLRNVIIIMYDLAKFSFSMEEPTIKEEMNVA